MDTVRRCWVSAEPVLARAHYRVVWLVALLLNVDSHDLTATAAKQIFAQKQQL
jgi:hypothetical protein